MAEVEASESSGSASTSSGSGGLMDKEQQALLKASVNYLYLAQFETFRATLRCLEKKNPQLAVAVLQAVVEKGGILDGTVAWSSRTKSSAQLLFLALTELIHKSETIRDANSGVPWCLDADFVKSRAEFLLLVDFMQNRLRDEAAPIFRDDDDGIYRRILAGLCGSAAEQGLQRLRKAVSGLGIIEAGDVLSPDEVECWRRLTFSQPGLVDDICENIQLQSRQISDEFPLGAIVARESQVAHLEALREALEKGDVDDCIDRLRFLRNDCGVENSTYRLTISDLIKKIKSESCFLGSSWVQSRERMLKIYKSFITSKNIHLVKTVETILDDIIREEAQPHSVSSENSIPLPLQKLIKNVQMLRSEKNEISCNLSVDQTLIHACKRELFHYVRVSGEHVFEIVLKAALSLVKVEQIQEASDILALFPSLLPLVAAMGWDLLRGNTKARRKMMAILWNSKSEKLRLEDLSIYRKQGDEMSCIYHHCDNLCYRLELAYFAACNKSGYNWDPATCKLFLNTNENRLSEDSDGGPLDPFFANLVLELLAIQTPLRVLFDVVPEIKFQDAVELVNMEPAYSPQAAWCRMQDVELLHMHYGIQAAVLALGSVEKNISDQEIQCNLLYFYNCLKNIQEHLEAVRSPPRKLFMLCIIISLLHMDGISVSSALYVVENTKHVSVSNGSEKQSVVSLISFILKILRDSVPSLGIEIGESGKKALEWRIDVIKQFIENWQWRLSVLQRLLPYPEHQWTWKEALAILRAAPSRLLNLCMQREQFDIGKEALHRFALPPEDRVALQLAEWVDGAFTRARIEDEMSRVAEGKLNVNIAIDFAAIQLQIGSLATALLCTDIALTSARSIEMSKKLIDQARTLLSDVSLGITERAGLSHWEHVQYRCIISVAKRVVQRLLDFLEQCTTCSLQSLLTGDTIGSAAMEIYRQGHRQRAFNSLEQVIEDAHMGKRQFLSGKLHNLVKAISDEELDESSNYAERKYCVGYEHDMLLGLGFFRSTRQTLQSMQTENGGESSSLNIKGTGKRFSDILTKQPSYLAAFIQYIANIGDVVDGTDTTHDFNFFTLVYEWPNDVLTRLVFERGNADAAGKVADIMGVDLAHEITSGCVSPVYPPKSSNGWACIAPVSYSDPDSNSGSHSSCSGPRIDSSSISSSKRVRHQLYPLQLTVIKHLATLSSVRAVLACVFGSMFSKSFSRTESTDSVGRGGKSSFLIDNERVFYEFALEQSERFPTLNRWIQMQANLHRRLDSPMTSKPDSEMSLQTNKHRVCRKRQRKLDKDDESEEDENNQEELGASISTSGYKIGSKDGKSKSIVLDDCQELKTVAAEHHECLFFTWENEAPYEETVERLISESKLLDALALSDRCLRNGASDRLLQLLIERGEESYSRPNQLRSYRLNRKVFSNSWQYCIRLRDKRLAAILALKNLHCWELEAAIDVLTMCSCHLSENDPLRPEVLSMKQALHKYRHILNADSEFGSWQQVESEFKNDPEGLALRLAGKGAVLAALEVADSGSLPITLRRELQGRQLVKLLTTDPVSGGGPAEASRFLSSLQEPTDALPVAMGAMQQLPNLRSKQLLIHFLLKHRAGVLSDGDTEQLNRWALGLRVLAALPLPWQQRCSALHEHPNLILETLLMWKQLQSAQKLIYEFPSLRDENLIFKYAAKAITIGTYPYTERKSMAAPVVNQPSNRSTAPTKLTFTSSLSNLHKEARKAFAWTSRDSGSKLASKEVARKRKNSGLPLSYRVAWETMAGFQEDRASVISTDGQERPTSIGMAEGCVLTGDPTKDEVARQSHRYESTPDIILFKALLSLCLDDKAAAKGALELCISEMKNVLSSEKLPLSASTEVVGRAYHATDTFVQALSYAKTQFKKILGEPETQVKVSKVYDVNEMPTDATLSSIDNIHSDDVVHLLSEADWWLSHAKLLQSLLGSGIIASLDDVRDRESAASLRDRLITGERYSMAVYTCKKCKIDAFPVWNAWGQALLRLENYSQARVKFKQALQLYKENPVPVILDIINIMESGPPVDLPGVRSLYNHLAKTAPTIMDDSLSADSYLNVLYMPASFPRSERLRNPDDDYLDVNKKTSLEYDEDGPRSNLDNIRYKECVSYLQEYARQELLGFMFRHGRYKDACLLFFPPDSTPSPPQVSVNQIQATLPAPQRTDSLATEYGTIEDLCELCVGYGAMPVLEGVIAARNVSSSMDSAVREHTAAALTRICNYCEGHRHFNHLYRFQVLKNDHVAAGLCSIQLFLNSSHQEQALKHLEHAKMHFEEGLSARHRAGDIVRSVSKTARTKSASEKLTEEELVKFSSRIGIQMEVVRSFSDADGPPWKHSLFGNPIDETFRRRCEVAETLVERNFDLAFQIIYEFQLPAVHIYAGVAASLAERKKGNQLTDFLKNIKGTIEDEEWDQVLGAAINVFATKHRERPDRLIDMLSSSHRKVLACVVCGRLKTAFQIASRSGNVADVQYVGHQASKTGAVPVMDMCKQWLQLYM